MPLGTNEETGTAWGAFFAAGVELNLGPGALLGEVQIGYGVRSTASSCATRTSARSV